MNRYNRPDFTTSRVEAPEVGSILTDFADRQQRQYQLGLSNAMEQAKAAEEKKRWDIANARAEAQAKRQEDEYQRGIAKETATNEALKAVLDPKKYQESKMAGEQAAIQSSLANLSPQDRVVAEQEIKANYRPEVSREQWLATALSGDNADQSKVLSTKKSVYDIAASTPGTPEYEAKVKADRAERLWESNLQLGKQKELARYSNSLADNKEEKKIKSMMDVLSVSPTATVDEVVNRGQIKNIEDRQAVFGNAYVANINKQKPQLDMLNDRINAAKSRMGTDPVANKGLLEQIDRDSKAITSIESLANRTALGQAGMGGSLLELPKKEIEQVSKTKSKDEFTKDMLASLGPKPSVEAITLASQEIAKRYPDIDKSVAGWNRLAEQYEGKAIVTGDSKVAEENAKAAVRLQEAKIKSSKKGSEFGNVDKTEKTAKAIFENYGSPDVIGSGDEITIMDKIYKIKADNGLKDDQMADILTQSSTGYRDEILGVDEDKFLREIEKKAKAYTGK